MTSYIDNKYILAVIGVIILLSVAAGFIVGYQIALTEHSTDYNEGWVLGYDKGYSDVVDLFNPTNYHSWNWSDIKHINSTEPIFINPTVFEYPVAIVNITSENADINNMTWVVTNVTYNETLEPEGLYENEVDAVVINITPLIVNTTHNIISCDYEPSFISGWGHGDFCSIVWVTPLENNTCLEVTETWCDNPTERYEMFKDLEYVNDYSEFGGGG